MGWHIPIVSKLYQRAMRPCRWFFYHPILRLSLAVLLCLLNLLLYAEDPTVESCCEYQVPVFGHAFSLIFLDYPNSKGLVALKVFMWITAWLLGYVIGRFAHRKFLRNMLRLRMFGYGCPKKERTKGSWPIQGFFILLFLYGATHLYNIMQDEVHLGSNMILTEWQMGRLLACIAFCLDLSQIYIIMDDVLQQDYFAQTMTKPPQTKKVIYALRYTGWAGALSRKWHGWVRLIAVWISFPIVLSAVTLLLTVLATRPHNFVWDDPMKSTEFGRVVIAVLICILDLIIPIQDWEFPTFDNPVLDVKIIGSDRRDFDFLLKLVPSFIFRLRLPQTVRKLIAMAHLQLYFSGRWVAYGGIMLAAVIDLIGLQSIIFYDPSQYGQFLKPDITGTHIWNIENQTVCDNYRASGTPISLAAWNGTRNRLMGVRWEDTPLSTRLLLPIPYFVLVLAVVLYLLTHRMRLSKGYSHEADWGKEMKDNPSMAPNLDTPQQGTPQDQVSAAEHSSVLQTEEEVQRIEVHLDSNDVPSPLAKSPHSKSFLLSDTEDREEAFVRQLTCNEIPACLPQDLGLILPPDLSRRRSPSRLTSVPL